MEPLHGFQCTRGCAAAASSPPSLTSTPCWPWPADGVVKLYDPRNTRQPVKTLRLQAGPVSSLHWQHRFLSLSRQRAAAAPASASQPAAAATGAALAPPAAAAAPSVGSRIPARTAAAVGAASTAGKSGLWMMAQQPRRLLAVCVARAAAPPDHGGERVLLLLFSQLLPHLGCKLAATQRSGSVRLPKCATCLVPQRATPHTLFDALSVLVQASWGSKLLHLVPALAPCQQMGRAQQHPLRGPCSRPGAAGLLQPKHRLRQPTSPPAPGPPATALPLLHQRWQ